MSPTKAPIKPFTAQDFSIIRSQMLFQFPFFGSLAMRLRTVERTQGIPTAATDGVSVFWNPGFFASLTREEAKFVVAHETMHCALGHMFRENGRNHNAWNIACDYALNPVLIKAGLKMPKDCLFDEKYDGMSAEQIYSLRKTTNPEDATSPMFMVGIGDGSTGDPQDGPGGAKISTGSFSAPPSGEADTPSEILAQDWASALEQAASVAQKIGKLPGGFVDMIEGSRTPTIPWQGVLAQFVTNAIASDVTWNRPNRRLISQGIYLPGVLKENIGEIVVFIDSSGSTTLEMQEDFAAELTSILHTCHPEKIHVVYVDAEVQDVREYTTDDTQIDLSIPGRGGTMFAPAFAWVEEQGIQPLCALYMTDLDNFDGVPPEPTYPVMWVTPDFITKKGPFGETLRITAR